MSPPDFAENDSVQQQGPNGRAAIIVGWLVGSLVASFGVVVGLSFLFAEKVLLSEIIGGTIFLFFSSLFMTWILMVFRGVFSNEISWISACISGAIGGIMLFFPSSALLISDKNLSENKLELLAIYSLSGVFAGLAWRRVEQTMMRAEN